MNINPDRPHARSLAHAPSLSDTEGGSSEQKTWQTEIFAKQPDNPKAQAPDLDAEEQIARLSLLQWESRGPWALAWILQHYPSAKSFWREGCEATKALASWFQAQQSMKRSAQRQPTLALQINALNPKAWRFAPVVSHWLQQSNHHVLWSLHDERYPEALQQLDAMASSRRTNKDGDVVQQPESSSAELAPRSCRALFVEGDPIHLHRQGLALVGGRACSDRAAAIAASFAGELARAGLSVISGMAEGIDAAAHLGALQGKGITVAVMGTGIDRCYPRRHQHLRERIAEQGAVISALLPGQGIEKFRFLQRNRLIAALAAAVLVVQARLQSGALSTAQAAVDLGKSVFAVPGSIDDPRYKGCHQLIRQGAVLTERMEDIFSELPWLLPGPQQPIFDQLAPDPNCEANESPLVLALRERMGQDAFDIHQLAGLMQSSYEAALVQSLRWEVDGLIHREPNGRYVLKML